MEFGGPVESKDWSEVISNGCDYFIPRSFAERWKEALDRLNEDGVE